MSTTVETQPQTGTAPAQPNLPASTEALYERCVLKNYGPAPFTLVRGEGSTVWDDAGNRYLDFTTGIAVTALGHSHPHWVKRVQEQAAKVVHVSNLYRNENQGKLASAIVDRAGAGKVLFCNSGTEANEALIKLARLHGKATAGDEGKRYKVLTAENAFHGRTFGGMAATPQEKIQGGFRPMLDGFAHGKLNDAASFEALIDDSTCAIMLETVQGEGGIFPCNAQFLRDIRALCNQHNLLMILDEVQCGCGRSGTFFAYEQAGVKPDAVGMAKGLGGGFPIGAIWIAEAFETLFTPGSHGTTFGGSPLASAAGLAVIETLEAEGLLAKVSERSGPWHAKLKALGEEFPKLVTGLRGIGYMVGVIVSVDNLDVMNRLRKHGMLTVRAGAGAVRLLPPLNASVEELDQSVEIFRNVLQEISSQQST